jgi:hypothetical protein
MKRYLGIAALVATGCSADIPEKPTYFADVQPILQANCSRCHGGRPFAPSIAGFRLDRYVKNDEASFDAWDYRDAILVVAGGDNPIMPPDLPLSDRQIEILQRWVDQGAPKGERDNRVPMAQLISPSSNEVAADQELAISMRTWDDDGDGLVVSLGYREEGGAVILWLDSDLPGGLHETVLDVGQWPSLQRFEVMARLDDGYSDDPAANRTIQKLLTVDVDHGAKGTAPTVAVLRPSGGSVVGETTIEWAATDPDGDTLSIDIDLLRQESDGSQTLVENLASGEANDSTFRWDSSTAPTDVPLLVRVTATDGINTRSDVSDASFTVAAPVDSTALTWADIRPILVMYCGDCHGEPARTPALDYFRLDKYNAADTEPPANSDLGVYEMRGDVYAKAISQGAMPPAAEPQPSAADLDKLSEWLLAGAPFGGSGDALPSVTWTTPNDSAISPTDGAGMITLQWSASDPEGLPLTGSIQVASLSAPADPQAFCDSSLTGWTAVIGADVEAGSFAFTAPATGYYCFKAVVTDDASQTVEVIAGRPVKY